MQCEKCDETIPSGEEREHTGMTLCEDCYIDAITPNRTCDPWAVYSAKTFMEKSGQAMVGNTQQKILDFLDQNGATPVTQMCDALNLSAEALEREAATLRHMEKIKGGLVDGEKVMMLWD